MATSPEQVRGGLTVVTSAASAELAGAATQAPPEQAADVLFQVTPLVVAAYTPATAALGVDWYEELREESPATSPFTPTAVTPLREDFLAGAVAWATEELRSIEADMERELEASLERLLPVVEREIAAALRETVTENTAEDPDAVGWQRFARPGGCKFCLMLADRGAVYTEATVDFAAHKNCNCLAGPSWDPDAPKASVMQYLGSSDRTPEQRKKLRKYLNQHFPNAPG
jgi:hypothetical protein